MKHKQAFNSHGILSQFPDHFRILKYCKNPVFRATKYIEYVEKVKAIVTEGNRNQSAFLKYDINRHTE